MAKSPAICPDCDSKLPAGCPALLCPVCALSSDDVDNPMRIGNFTLLGEIARGGMGVVYRARQEKLRRTVAVKVLPGAAFSSPESRLRFQREAETAARLQHAGIVAIHEVGEHLGQPFIAMEFVDGPSLATRLAGGPLKAETAARIIREVAHAVAHAHERGVVHRDLKPANVLLRSDSEPVLTDFGLAKLTAPGSTLTLAAPSVGSPGYMPPERMLAGAGDGKASVAEDVYGLGAVLYHCISGRPPFVADSIAAVMALTQSSDPLPPRALVPSVPLDLQTICLRCLEKSPSQRYASAADVADELTRFLNGEPIRARPLGFFKRQWRRAKRRPLVAALSVALAVSVIGGSAASFIGWRAAATESESRRVSLYSSNITAAASAMNEGHPDGARALLDEAATADLRGPEWHVLHQMLAPRESFSAQAHSHILTAVAWHPDGKRLLSASHDGSVKLWNFADGRLDSGSQVIAPGTPRVNAVQWLPSGDAFLVAESRQFIRLRALGKESPLWEIPGQSFSLSADGKMLASSTAGPFFYDAAGTVSTWKMNGSAKPEMLENFPQKARAVALSPDARFLAMSRAGGDGTDSENGVVLIDLSHRDAAPKLLPTPGSAWALRFSPDAAQLAVAPFVSGKGDVFRFETASGNALLPAGGRSLRPTSLVFTPDSERMVVSSTDRSLQTWSADGGSTILGSAHENEIWCTALHPGGKWLASGDKSGILKIFPFPLPRPFMDALPRFPHYRYAALAFTPDSSAVMTIPRAMHASATMQSTTTREQRPLATKDIALGFAADGSAAEWNPSKSTFASAGKSFSMQMAEDAVERHPYLSGDGHFAAVIRSTGDVHRMDLRNGAFTKASGLLLDPARGDGEFICAALSRDGRYAAIATWRELAVHDFTASKTLRFPNDPHWARDIAFSDDGKLLATAGIDGNIVIRRLPDGAPFAVLKGHIEEASAVAFSPDGRTLVSSELGHGLRFWRLDTLREVLHLPLKDVGDALRFSPDGRHLAVLISPQGSPPEAASLILLPTK